MIRWTRVTELRDEVGAEDFDEVVELFLEEVQEVIGRIRSASNQNDLGSELHFLKGSALSLGFHAFSELCQAGERAIAAGNTAAVDIDEIIAGFDASRDLFQQELESRLK